jgi:hypothetical protein
MCACVCVCVCVCAAPPVWHVQALAEEREAAAGREAALAQRLASCEAELAAARESQAEALDEVRARERRALRQRMHVCCHGLR